MQLQNFFLINYILWLLSSLYFQCDSETQNELSII